MNGHGDPGRVKSAAVALAGAVLATAGFFHRATLTNDVFSARDILRVYYPLRRYWADRVSSGELPDWFPFDGLGQPFAGMVVSGAFHPANLLYLALPLGAALKLNTLACFVAAAVGAHALARRYVPSGAAWTTALAYAFCGYLVGITNNLLYLMSAATFPWVLWAADRLLEAPTLRRAALLGATLALVLLAGDPQGYGISVALCFCLLPARRGTTSPFAALAWLGVAVGASLALGAPQLVAGAHAFVEGRMSGQTLEAALIWSAHPLRLLELLVGPIFAGDPGDPAMIGLQRQLLETGKAGLWVDSLYLGPVVVVLAAAGVAASSRRWLWWWAAGGILAWLALGSHGGLYAFVFRHLPGWSAFRYPEKLLPYVVLLVCLAAGLGHGAVAADVRLRKRAAAALGLLGVALLIYAGAEDRTGVGAAQLVHLFGDPTRPPTALGQLSQALVRGALIAGVSALNGAALLGVSSAAAGGRLGERVLLALPLVVLAGAYAAGAKLYELASPEILESPTALVAEVKRAAGPAGPGRIFRLGGRMPRPALEGVSREDLRALGALTAMEPVTPALFGLEGANTYLPAASRRVVELTDQEREWVHGRAALYSTTHLSVPPELLPQTAGSAGNLVLAHPDFGHALLHVPEALPRVYLARPRCVPSGELAHQAVRAGTFKGGEEAVVEGCAVNDAPAPSGAVATVKVRTPERWVVRTASAEPGVLVVNEAFYSGWRATVDGMAAPVLPANYAVQGVLVPAGERLVELEYRTPWLREALLAAAIAAGLLGILALWEGFGRRDRVPGG